MAKEKKEEIKRLKVTSPLKMLYKTKVIPEMVKAFNYKNVLYLQRGETT